MPNSFLGCPEYEPNHSNVLRKMINVIKGIMQGKTNNTDMFTLTASSTTTILTLAEGRIGVDTVILWEPITSNAAGAMTNLYESGRSVANSTITLTHANAATIDRTFRYVLIG